MVGDVAVIPATALSLFAKCLEDFFITVTAARKAAVAAVKSAAASAALSGCASAAAAAADQRAIIPPLQQFLYTASSCFPCFFPAYRKVMLLVAPSFRRRKSPQCWSLTAVL